MPTFNKLPPEIKELLNLVPSLIKKTFPIPKKYRGALPSSVRELSHLLTNKRGDRSLSYLGRPNYLNAYLHYFLPWNLYRLCFLLPGLDLKFNPGDTITDLGSGPLTFASALWIARPDLRKIPLEINCIDRSSPALEAGNVFFSALCADMGENAVWKIKPVREDIDFRKQALHKEKKTNLVCAVNLFNEIYEKIPHNNTEKLKQTAANTAQLMHNIALPDSSILTVEPGVPQSGRFISLLRDTFIELERPPVSPCTHTETCPFYGSPAVSEKKRWCHFAFEAADAPKELLRLSTATGLPKERLVFSYLLTGKISQMTQKTKNALRVISDAFPLPQNRFGRYGCSSAGLVLLQGEKKQIEKFHSGVLAPIHDLSLTGSRDTKSGALIMEVK